MAPRRDVALVPDSGGAGSGGVLRGRATFLHGMVGGLLLGGALLGAVLIYTQSSPRPRE